MKTLTASIVTPEKVVFKEEAEFVVLPGQAGELGILPGHEHLIAQLKAGKARFLQSQGEKFFLVAGGFLRVSPNEVKIFTASLQSAENMSRSPVS